MTIDVDNTDGEERITVEVTSLGNADHVNLGGNAIDDFDSVDGDDVDGDEGLEVGDVHTIHDDSSSGLDGSGTITAIAVIEEDGTETQVASESYDFD